MRFAKKASVLRPDGASSVQFSCSLRTTRGHLAVVSMHYIQFHAVSPVTECVLVCAEKLMRTLEPHANSALQDIRSDFTQSAGR
jgi:hypothetical protein